MERSKDLFLFRLNRLAATAGRPLIRLCEGQYGITRREWRLIVILAQDGPLLSTALASRASIEPPRASRAITLLEGKRLICRVRQPSDRRFVHIMLTDEGLDLYRSLYPSVEAIDRQLLAALTEPERSHLTKVFTRLEEAAERLQQVVPNLPKTNRQRIRP